MSERSVRSHGLWRLMPRWGGPLVGLLALVILVRTDRFVEAARPGELARLMPPEPLVVLEADDLPGLIRSWRDCELRRDVEATDVYQRCRASRVALRLGERRDLLDAVLAEPLSWERLASLPGERGGLALYNIGETRFVLWLRLQRGVSERLSLLRPELEVVRRERGGSSYVIHEGNDETSTIAAGVVGDLLIVSNDEDNFQRAWALATGEQARSLAGDRTYVALTRAAPAEAETHLFLDLGRLLQTRQFRRYWVHHNGDDLQGLDRALISLTFAPEGTTEHRLLSYRGGVERLPAGQQATSAAGSSSAERLAALPHVGAAYVALRSGEAASAAAAARWIWPGAAGHESGPEALRALLARGRVARYVEVLRPRLGRDGFTPTDQLALALMLEAPDSLATEEVVSAGARALADSLAGVTLTGTPTARRSSSRGVIVHTLSPLLPGLRGLSVSRSRDGAVLVLSTSPLLASEIAVLAQSTTPLGQALATAGPDVASLDYEQTSELLTRRLELITAPEAAGDASARGFLGSDVPELLSVSHLTRVERITSREGELDRQIVRYIYE